jgi:hypothetical protein
LQCFLLPPRLHRNYAPLQKWFLDVYGERVGTATGFAELLHPEGAYTAAEDAVNTANPWLKAALSSALNATKSTIVSLALVHRFLDVEGAFSASRLEEEWQIGENGYVEDGHDSSRAQTRSTLASVSAFLSLLPLELQAQVRTGETEYAERKRRVEARRSREWELVNAKRSIMKAQALEEARQARA